MEIELSLAPYPGRGIVHHVAPDGSTGWIYFVTGRSHSSRAREIAADADSLTVRPTDPGLPTDALRHYRCVRRAGDGLVVGNGDHVDVVADALMQGSTVNEAAQLLEPEPDSPLFTPRIALVIGTKSWLVAVRRSDGSTDRVVLGVEAEPSTITILSTYSGWPDQPLGTAPIATAADGRSLMEVAERIWHSLDRSTRVALVAGRAGDTTPLLSFAERSPSTSSNSSPDDRPR